MTRRYPASETSKRMRAKQAFALERRELRQPSEAREAPASPTSFPIITAMGGAVGGGGLGDLGIRYGYQRFLPDVMAAVVMVLIVMVQLVQSGGDLLARHVDKRNLKS